MNEAETRAELIDPQLKNCGWGVVEDSKILREYSFTAGKIEGGGITGKKLKADYILVYKNIKLAVIEAKSKNLHVNEGIMQAKQYAEKLNLETTYSANGEKIYQICLKTGEEGLVTNFLSPQKLWDKTYSEQNNWRDKFSAIPYETKSGSWHLRYYQEIAIKKTLEAIAQNKNRILLNLATGTGKTAIAFQIAWKLFKSNWNLKKDGKRQPRILFLADRNILADQAFNSFSAFSNDAKARIKPSEIKKKGRVPTNANIFFTIFQTCMAGSDAQKKPKPYFSEYPPDYFDFIIIDECHRGGANDESSWRAVLDYFSPAVQLGLTATPKQKDNTNTYQYFGNPVYSYSLNEGIKDGFLTPFKVKRISTTLDEYIYSPDDDIIEGEIKENELYTENKFNIDIEIEEREKKRVQIYMNEAHPNEKAIIFCANQAHAALIRNLVNQYKQSDDINYCVRVTANDGTEGERLLRKFQDTENTIPTILTTSKKLSTGVDAPNIRNIVLMRPVKQMIEFKQIIGRGTRLSHNKYFFTVYDFVNASKKFSDPDWDGEPLTEDLCNICGKTICICKSKKLKLCPKCNKIPCICIKPLSPCNKCKQIPCICEKPNKIKIKVKLKNGKDIQFMMATSLLNADGKVITAQQYLNDLLGTLPEYFKNEAELHTLWSHPTTRNSLLNKLEEKGFKKNTLKELADAQNSDLFDVLKYIFNSDQKLITRKQRVTKSKQKILQFLNPKQKEFIEFVLNKYIEAGIGELDPANLHILLENKYNTIPDAKAELEESETQIKCLFIDFQKDLYSQKNNLNLQSRSR